MSIRKFLRFVPVIGLLPFAAAAQGLDAAKIDAQLGRSGQKTGDAYKVGFPRTDLHVSVHGLAIKAGFALGSWAAFSGTDDNASVMGDLVLLEDEINPVLDKLKSAGFEITAIHNHLAEETPRVMYMHYMGHGPAAQLATSLRAALGASKTPLEKPAAGEEPPSPPAWVDALEKTLGRKGTFKGGVLAYGIARANPVTMDGMTIAPAAGVAEAIIFQAADSGNVATTGDFVLTAAEVNPVIAELRSHKIRLTALHSHMLTEEPRLFFMHFWAVGTPESVGAGIDAALKRVAVK
jgi:hypothetical protein